MKKRTLKTKLSLAFALTALLTVALISVLSNIFINYEFKKYIGNQNEKRTMELVASLSEQYDGEQQVWNIGVVHAIGMYALYDGYIVRVLDAEGQVLWDAQECNMSACMRVMEDISKRMTTKCPRLKAKYTNLNLDLSQDGDIIGSVNIGYFGPYFLSDNDFQFLDTLNKVLLGIGAVSLIASAFIGFLMSKRISDPIVEAAKAARRMSGGDYMARIEGQNDTMELDELISSVNQLAEALSRQEALRKQLTADVAHELRTPITTVGTHLEAMIEGIWQPTTERLSGCHEEISRIGTLVEDLESLARVDSDNIALDKNPVNLTALLKKVIDGFEMDIQGNSLTVTLDGTAPEVSADEDRIRQVAVNLLSNAVKYTPSGGHISVTVSSEEGFAVFTVSDDGPGIPANELPFIFERFYRADKSRNRKTGGSGIGLAIVKAIVEAHGGKVKAMSQVGEGSRFTVMLPL